MEQVGQSKKSRFREWLIRPVVRGFLMGGSTLVIGILGAFIGITTGIVRITLIIAVIGLALLYFTLVIVYGTIDNSYAWVMKQNKAYELTMSNFISIFQQSSRNANKLIHEIISDGRLNLNSWNFDLASELVCEKIFDLLCTLDDADKNFGVGYVRLDESAEMEEDACVYMTAFIDKTRSLPTIHKERRKLNAPLCYHDVQLFLNGSADTEILMTPEEISDVFVYSTQEKRNAGKKKYTQYIAIPVICVTEPKNKMVGLLEIVCSGQKLSSKRDVIERIVANFLAPYAQLFLLLHKLEKALIAVPNNKSGGNKV